MRCPFCSYLEDKVVDSRLVREGRMIRRRRQCIGCERRFTTYESVEESTPIIVKKDGRREAYDRRKMRGGILAACQKRPVPTADIDKAVERIESTVLQNASETPAEALGEAIAVFLKATDPIAYIRFASVYRNFADLSEFLSEIKDLDSRG